LFGCGCWTRTNDWSL